MITVRCRRFILMGIAGLSVAAVVAAGEETSPTPEPARERQVEIAFAADFLRPTTSLHSETDPQAIEFGSVTWESSTEGDVPARMWGVSAPLHFKLAADGVTLQKLDFNAPGRGGVPQLWDVWRHRHGYLYGRENGYFWNGFEDEKEPLSEQDGRFYDGFLKDLWTFWTVKKLPALLARTATIPTEAAPSPTPDVPEMRQRFPVSYDTHGLREPASFTFEFWAWNVPVRVTCDVLPSTSTLDGSARFKARWTYDESEWRRVHGYGKDLFGYSWDKDFPHQGPLTSEEGEKLDRLLEKTVEYWVDAALQQMSTQVDAQLALAVREYAAELTAGSEEEKRSRRDLNPRSLP